MTARAAAVVAGAAAAIAIGAIAVVAQAPSPFLAPAPTPLNAAPLPAIAAAGRGWRIDAPRGPIRVWVPAGYHPDGAATVVYVHGYYTDVDRAWIAHRLPEQFALSAMNAVFIAPEAPSGGRQGVHWPSLADLLAEVFAATALPRPMGPVVAIGHSGAHRTLRTWMDYPGLDILVALDAMYDQVEEWREWLEGSPRRRLIAVGDDTVRWTEDLAREIGDAATVLDGFPDPALDPPPDLGATRALYIRSQYGHMALVTEGVALPQLLRWLPIETLADGPWHRPLGLPPIEAGTGSDAGVAPASPPADAAARGIVPTP